MAPRRRHSKVAVALSPSVHLGHRRLLLSKGSKQTRAYAELGISTSLFATLKAPIPRGQGRSGGLPRAHVRPDEATHGADAIPIERGVSRHGWQIDSLPRDLPNSQLCRHGFLPVIKAYPLSSTRLL